MKPVVLRVQNAKKRDTGKYIIRVDQKIMEKLNIQTGDVIEIIGKKQSAGIAWPSFPQDNDLGIVRINSRLQKNTGTKIGDNLEIRKVSAEVAQRILLSPVDVKIRNNPRFESFTKRKLMNLPVTLDDLLYLSIGLTRELAFKVKDMIPSGVCVIKRETLLQISEEPIEGFYTDLERISFDNIGGLENEINEVRKILELASIKKLNMEIPRGILFVGPPGVGKTLVAKAFANDLNFYFISILSPEILQKFYGGSEKKLRNIFQEAEDSAPSIIFFDHIDAIAIKIQEQVKEKYNYVEHRIVTELMGLIDRLHQNKRVFVIAATHKIDLIEPALLRPGRFDKIIHFPLPDLNDRTKIYEIHTRNLQLDSDISLEELAEFSNNFTGADIKGVCQLATINAAKRNLPDISSEIEKISDEEIEKVKLNKQDFLKAIKEIKERLDLVPRIDY